jgi:hypothetical protein
MGSIVTVRLEWTRYPDGFELTDDPNRIWEERRSRVRPRLLGPNKQWPSADCDEVRNARMTLACAAAARAEARRKNEPPGRFLVPRKPKRSESYLLEGTAQHVFIDLANVQDDDTSVLAFVDKWGLLNNINDNFDASRSTPAMLGMDMRRAIANLQRDPPDWMLRILPRLRRAKLAGDSAPRIFLQPDDLFGFCCAEFLQFMEAGIEIRTCPRCGTLFAMGKVGKPPLYCSRACKVAIHRKAKRARELRASKRARVADQPPAVSPAQYAAHAAISSTRFE